MVRSFWLDLDPADVESRDDGVRQALLDLGPILGRDGSTAIIVLDNRPGRAGVFDPATGDLDRAVAEPRLTGPVEGAILGIVVQDADGAHCRLQWDGRLPPGRWMAEAMPLLAHDRLRTTVRQLLTLIGSGRPSEMLVRLDQYRKAIRDLHASENSTRQADVANVVAWEERMIRRDVAAWWRATHPGVAPPLPSDGGSWTPFVEDAIGSDD